MDNYFVRLFVVLLGGEFGLHYYVSGRIGKGLLYTFTFGLLGIGYIYDLFRTIFSSYNIFADWRAVAVRNQGMNTNHNVNTNVVNVNIDKELLRSALKDEQ